MDPKYFVDLTNFDFGAPPYCAMHPIIDDDDGFGDDNDYKDLNADAEYNDNDNEEKKGSMCSVSHY